MSIYSRQPVAAKPAPGWLHPVAHLRSRLPEPIIMPTGRPARARLARSVTWVAVTGACAAALVAGIYFNLFEVNWHLFWLKHWWDGGMDIHVLQAHLADWDKYRHGERDQGEPEAAFLIIGMLIAPRKTWSRRAPLWYMAVAPVLLLVLSAVLIAGLVWLLNFGIPQWAGVSALNHWVLFGGTLIGGFLIGRIVKPIWRPVGATINGWFVDWSVDRYQVRQRAAHQAGKVIAAPAWVRHWYLAPIQLQERWMWQVANNQVVTYHRHLSPGAKLAITAAGSLFLLVIAYLTVTGFIGHFWVGTGHSVPFLAPAQ